MNVENLGWAGVTPLMTAATAGNVPAIQHLLARGADISTANKRGWTAAMYCAKEGRAEAMEVLLSTISEGHRHRVLEQRSAQGKTAVAIAVASGQAETAEVLATYGAVIEMEQAASALLLAGQSGLHALGRAAYEAQAHAKSRNRADQTQRMPMPPPMVPVPSAQVGTHAD